MTNWLDHHKQMLADSNLTPEEQTEWIQKIQDAYDKITESQKQFDLAMRDSMIFGTAQMEITEDGEIFHIPYSEGDDE